jgi:hypothetical protein
MAGMSGANAGGQNFFERAGMDKPGLQRRIDGQTQSQAQKPKSTIAGMQETRPFTQRSTAGGNSTIGSSGQKLGA